MVVVADVLHDHVHLDIGFANGTEDLVGHTRHVRHAQDGELGLVAVECDAGDCWRFHLVRVLQCDQRAGAFLKAVQHPQGHLVFAGKFHRADLQHLGAHAGHFQHLLEGDPVQPAGAVHHPRVGGVDTVHVGVDLAFIRFEGGGQRHGGGVGTAAAQGGDIAVLVHALEARPPPSRSPLPGRRAVARRRFPGSAPWCAHRR